MLFIVLHFLTQAFLSLFTADEYPPLGFHKVHSFFSRFSSKVRDLLYVI